MFNNPKKLLNQVQVLYPYIGERGRLKRALYRDPFPIIYPDKRLVLLWSAKAGCTFAIKWIFSQMDILQDAMAYNPWVHRYRQDVYFAKGQHHKGARLFLQHPDEFQVIKIVANPFKRAVSSFVHASIMKYEDKQLSNFLGRRIDPQNRFTFREFVKYLNVIDITSCNSHHRLQTTELDRTRMVEPITVVRLDDSMNEIPKLEKHLQLKTTDLITLRKSKHHRPKVTTDRFMGDTKLNSIYGVKNASVPVPESFYDSEIQALVANAYREDFTQYNFDPTKLGL